MSVAAAAVEHRAHTAPAALGVCKETPCDVEPSRSEAEDHPEYAAWFDAVPRGDATRLARPRYLSRFAGRLPPTTTLRQLHSAGRAQFFDPVDPPRTGPPPPSDLVTLTEADEARSRAMKPQATYQEPPVAQPEQTAPDEESAAASRPVDNEPVPAVTAPPAAPSPAATRAALLLQRQMRRYLAARGAQRAVGAVHLVRAMGKENLRISAAECSTRGLAYVLAAALEYECVLHSENYAEVLLASEHGTKPLRKALVSATELSAVVAAAADCVSEIDEAMHLPVFFNRSIPNVECVLRATHGGVLPPRAAVEATTLPEMAQSVPLTWFGSDVTAKTLAEAVPEPQLTRMPDADGQVPRVVALEPRVAPLRVNDLVSSSNAGRDTGFRPPNIASPPIDDEEARIQAELGIALGADDARPVAGSLAPLDARPFVARSTWTRDVPTPLDSEFVDLEELRRAGEGAACFQPRGAKRHGAAVRPTGVCVVCELDNVETMECPCGNAVHPLCGARNHATGGTHCCAMCATKRWNA